MLCIYILPTLIETQVTLWAVETSGYSVPFKPLLNAEHLADLIELTEVHGNYLQSSINVAFQQLHQESAVLQPMLLVQYGEQWYRSIDQILYFHDHIFLHDYVRLQ